MNAISKQSDFISVKESGATMSERKKSGGASKDKDQKKVKAVKAASDR